MWIQNYQPVGGSLGLSAAVSSIPILVLFAMLGIFRKPVWMAALAALGSALIIALAAYRMPVNLAIMSTLYGAAYGVFPIAWIVFSSIMLYRLAVATGKFEIIKDSIGGLTNDRRLQALFIAFSFGAFIEGAAGFGAPVAVSGALLVGLGFSPFYAAGICLLANTAPVAFGSIGIPVVTLANVTGLPEGLLSAMTGRLCAIISVIIPMYLLVVMVGFKKMMEVLPAVIVCGISFAGVQFYVSNYMGAALTDILSSLSCIICMVIVLKVWKPKSIYRLEGEPEATHKIMSYTGGQIFMAWVPYLLLVVFVLVWGHWKADIDYVSHRVFDKVLTVMPYKGEPDNPGKLNNVPVPLLHAAIERVPPVTKGNEPYAATYRLDLLGAAGTACFLASIATALVLRVKPKVFLAEYIGTWKQLAKPILTIASMLGLAYLMNYSGMTSTLGLALAHTGVSFPFFSAILGWLGVFITGSDTAANALFGNLQKVTAEQLHLNPVLTTSVNSAAGVMGKMISLSSIAVAVAATGLKPQDESRLFRFTIKHSVLLVVVVGIISLLFAYVFPAGVPVIPAETMPAK